MTIDLTGRKFGRVTVLRQTDLRVKCSIVWECTCRCGATALISSRDLLHTNRKGCGNCADTKHPLYRTWRGIISRCTDSNNPSYKHYGGRGITVCDRWKTEFLNFVEDMGERPKNFSVERIDVNGNYTPENCKWADVSEQAHNKRIFTRKLTPQDLLDIYVLSSYTPSKYLALYFGVSIKAIGNIKCKLHCRKQLELALQTLTPSKIEMTREFIQL